MAVTKTIEASALVMEIASGKDNSGNTTYKKKTFSNVRTNAAAQDLFDVATAIKGVMKVETRNFYVTDSSSLINA